MHLFDMISKVYSAEEDIGIFASAAYPLLYCLMLLLNVILPFIACSVQLARLRTSAQNACIGLDVFCEMFTTIL